jgi:hypothetical protein
VPNFFSQLWTRDEYRWHQQNATGLPLEHAVSTRFTERGVCPGDMLYVWSFVRGRLFLIGRMEIDEIGPYQRAVQRLGRSNFSSNLAEEHAISQTCTIKQFGQAVPMTIVSQLRFVSPNGEVSPAKFRSPSEPDPQTFRGVRQLTPASAALLDPLLSS